MDTTWGSYDNVSAARLELLNVFLDNGTTDAGLYLDSHVLTEWVYFLSNLKGKFACWGDDERLAVLRNAVCWVSFDRLEYADTEGASLTSTWLSLKWVLIKTKYVVSDSAACYYVFFFRTYLYDGIFPLNNWQNCLLLYGKRVFPTVAVNTSKNTLLQSHIVELINFQIRFRFKSLFHYLFYTRNRTQTRLP